MNLLKAMNIALQIVGALSTLEAGAATSFKVGNQWYSLSLDPSKH